MLTRQCLSQPRVDLPRGPLLHDGLHVTEGIEDLVRPLRRSCASASAEVTDSSPRYSTSWLTIVAETATAASEMGTM